MGITRVANVTGLDRIGIPVALAVRPNSKSVAVSQGKGTTLQHAKASAMMEAIEIWHAENFSGSVYYGKMSDLHDRWRMVQTNHLPKQPGSDFSATTPLLWVEGADLFTGDKMLVPFEMVHADYTRPIPPTHGHFPASTNGLASGNSDLEAICHGVAEVIERDALSLWHFTQEDVKRQNRIDPATVQDAECRRLINLVERAELSFGLWNVTSNIRVPSILCIIRDHKEKTGHVGLGSGCHVTSSVALRRAITEAAQTRLNYISGSRDDLGLAEFEATELAHKQRYADAFLNDQHSPLNFSDIPSPTLRTLREDLDFMLRALSAVGISEAIWVNMGKEEFGIPVARIVVPGLEAPHDDDDYVPGPRAQVVNKHG